MAFAAYIARPGTGMKLVKLARKALGTSGGQWQLCQLTKPKKGVDVLCCVMRSTMCSAKSSSSYLQLGSWFFWEHRRELLRPLAGPSIFHKSVSSPRLGQ